MDYEKLNDPKIQEKLKGAKTPEDLLAIAQEEGYDLTDEELEAVSGGINADWCTILNTYHY